MRKVKHVGPYPKTFWIEWQECRRCNERQHYLPRTLWVAEGRGFKCCFCGSREGLREVSKS